VRIAVGAKSDRGRLRESNEDTLLVQDPLFAVADGMGGHLAGEVASQTAVAVIKQMASVTGPKEPGALESYVSEANSSIHQKAGSDAQLSGMGTTCTLLYIDDGNARVAHVGDSRAYLVRDGHLSQITKDHTLVERMVQEGRIMREDASKHPQRSIITRALGVEPNVQVDSFDIELREGDRVLLCSDGLTSMVDDTGVEEILREVGDPQEAADRLVDEANRAGGEDNISVVVVDYGRGAGTGAVYPRVDTARGGADNDGPMEKRSPLRRLLAAFLIAAIVAGGGYFVARWSLSRSYFVGATEDGLIAIYTGIPEEIAGLSLREEEEITQIKVRDLPEALRDNVEEGIKVESLDEARDRVTDLAARAEEFRDSDGRGGNGKGKGSD
jgi:protein phosphatase